MLETSIFSFSHKVLPSYKGCTLSFVASVVCRQQIGLLLVDKEISSIQGRPCIEYFSKAGSLNYRSDCVFREICCSILTTKATTIERLLVVFTVLDFSRRISSCLDKSKRCTQFDVFTSKYFSGRLSNFESHLSLSLQRF